MRRALMLAGLLAAASSAAAEAGAPPPELRLTGLDGLPRSLADERGRLVVLNFWATWCLPCIAEMPLLSAIRERYEGRGVRVIGVSADGPEGRDRVEAFVREHRPGIDVWLGGTVEHMRALGLGEGLPATAILDRDGTVAMRILGPIAGGDLEARLEWLLGPRAGPAPERRLDRLATGGAGAGKAPGQAEEGGESAAGDEHGHRHDDGDGHEHGVAEEHQHGAIAIEGASLVPS
jgi:thiol-disulfide isomerase/thioredoxin